MAAELVENAGARPPTSGLGQPLPGRGRRLHGNRRWASEVSGRLGMSIERLWGFFVNERSWAGELRLVGKALACLAPGLIPWLQKSDP